MNTQDNIHRFHDGELSVEEEKQLKKLLQNDVELAEEHDSIKALTSIHQSSIPDAKDEVFIEREFQSIFSQIKESEADFSETSAHSQQSNNGPKVIPFTHTRWFKSTVGIAAAMLLTATGIFGWNIRNQSNTDFHNQDSVAFVETDIDGASSMIFMDEQSGWTFVWVDEPEIIPEVAG